MAYVLQRRNAMNGTDELGKSENDDDLFGGWFEQGEVRERVPSERGCWNQFYLQLQVALQSGGPLPVDARDALATTRVLDAARLSFERHQVVQLSPFESHGTKLE